MSSRFLLQVKGGGRRRALGLEGESPNCCNKFTSYGFYIFFLKRLFPPFCVCLMQSTTVISRPLLAKPASSEPFPPLLLLGRLSEKKRRKKARRLRQLFPLEAKGSKYRQRRRVSRGWKRIRSGVAGGASSPPPLVSPRCTIARQRI